MSLDVFMFGEKDSKEMTRARCEDELNSRLSFVSLVDG